jgi:transcriptional regulator GlxA family with amidase domain
MNQATRVSMEDEIMEFVRLAATGLLLASCAGEKQLKPPASPPEAGPQIRNVAIIVFQGVELLDFAGPGEVFSSAGRGAFNVFTVATSTQAGVSQGFVKIVPDYAIDGGPKPDIVVIPGGDASAVYDDPKMMTWIKKSADSAELTMSVCNGAIALAKTGLLDGLKATTHWGSVNNLRQFPRVTVLPSERFVDTGHIAIQPRSTTSGRRASRSVNTNQQREPTSAR